MDATVETLLEKLISEGKLTDPEKAKIRLRLGYPSWLVLEELGPEGATEVLSRETGIRALKASLTVELVDIDVAPSVDSTVLKSRRWVPLVDGRVAVADPLRPFPGEDSVLAGRPVCLAPGREIERS